jgi:outer membrane cobalamin receptor
MNNYILKYTLLVSLFCFSLVSSAQDKKTETTPNKEASTISEEIEIIRPYKPVLADAVKIRRNPDMGKQKPFKPVLNYNIIDKKLELNSNIKELQAQKMAEEPTSLLINNHVKLGAGNFNTTQGEFYINNGGDQALQTGAFIKHLSQKGNLDRQQFSNQEFGLFGKTISDTYTATANLNYDRRSSYFYGFDPFASVNPEKNKQNINSITAEAEIVNKYDEESTFNYAAGLKTYHFNTIDNAKESSFLLNTYLDKDLKLFSIGFNASADLSTTKDTEYKIANNILKANPFINLKSDNFDLKLGANIVQEFGTNSRLNIFPSISAEFAILPGYANIFANLNGDVLKTSIREIAIENPFINRNLSIKNSVEALNIQAGVKGNVGVGFGYKIMGFYKNIEDMLLMVNNQSLINRFDVIYDQGKSSVFGLEGELNMKASDMFDINAKAQIFNYDLATEAEAWFKPNLRLISNAKARITEKISVDAELLFQGETAAKLTINSTEFNINNVKAFIDLSAGAEYKVNNKIGVYLRANNLFGQNYQRYLYYPNMGLTLFGGLNFSF